MVLKQVDHRPEQQMLLLEDSLVVLDVEQFWETPYMTVLDESSVLGCNPAVLPSEADDRNGIGEVPCPVLDHFLQLAIALERDEISFRGSFTNDVLGLVESGPLDIFESFEMGECTVLEECRSGLP